MPAPSKVIVRPMAAADFDAVVGLQRLCFPEPFPEELLWSREHLAGHLELFPEGQMAAVLDGEIVGSASALRVTRARWQDHTDWDDLTGGLSLERHEPEGAILYGADISVHPSVRRMGIGRALYGARFDLVRELGLDAFATVCRLPDCRAWMKEHSGTPLDYARAVERGEAKDRTLTPFLKMGMKLMGVDEDVMDDPESLDAGARLEWRP
jgi:ribosomal protein S18 acetylase RimI-like enzyme